MGNVFYTSKEGVESMKVHSGFRSRLGHVVFIFLCGILAQGSGMLTVKSARILADHQTDILKFVAMLVVFVATGAIALLFLLLGNRAIQKLLKP
jgi:hypothetical protein